MKKNLSDSLENLVAAQKSKDRKAAWGPILKDFVGNEDQIVDAIKKARPKKDFSVITRFLWRRSEFSCYIAAALHNYSIFEDDELHRVLKKFAKAERVEQFATLRALVEHTLGGDMLNEFEAELIVKLMQQMVMSEEARILVSHLDCSIPSMLVDKELILAYILAIQTI